MTAAFFINAPRGPRGRAHRRDHRGVPRQDRSPRRPAGVWLGVGAAVVLSIAGGPVVATVGRLPLVVQETVEGLAAVIAVIVLTWMLFWMRRQGRAMKGELEHGVDAALAGGSALALAGSRSWPSPARGSRRSCSCSRSGVRAGESCPARRPGRPGGRRRHRLGHLRGRASGSTCGGSSPSPAIVLIFVSAGLVASPSASSARPV